MHAQSTGRNAAGMPILRWLTGSRPDKPLANVRGSVTLSNQGSCYRAATVSTYVVEFLSFWHEYFREFRHFIDGKGVKWHFVEIKRLSLILASGTFLRHRVVKRKPPELYRTIQAPVWFRLRRVRRRFRIWSLGRCRCASLANRR